jgi:hypothetical protein
VKVPPGQDGEREKDEAEDLIAAEGAELGCAAGFGGFLFEMGLDAGWHGASEMILSPRDFDWRQARKRYLISTTAGDVRYTSYKCH